MMIFLLKICSLFRVDIREHFRGDDIRVEQQRGAIFGETKKIFSNRISRFLVACSCNFARFGPPNVENTRLELCHFWNMNPSNQPKCYWRNQELLFFLAYLQQMSHRLQLYINKNLLMPFFKQHKSTNQWNSTWLNMILNILPSLKALPATRVLVADIFQPCKCNEKFADHWCGDLTWKKGTIDRNDALEANNHNKPYTPKN